MDEKKPAHSQQAVNQGLLAGIAAYLFWGVFPIYFKLTETALPTEVLAHRIVWSVPFGFIIILFRKQLGEVIGAFKSPKIMTLLLVSSIAICVNWLVYIWAIQNDQIFQGSLGYYINPLINVLFGLLFFGERFSKLQGLAISLAALGVLVLTVYGGQFPLIALTLAFSFGIYGALRKHIIIGALPGLFIETVFVFIPALFYGLYLKDTGVLQFGGSDMQLNLLLIAAGPFTVLPLIGFAVAARRLKLSTLGFLQFIAPTLQFVCGLYYGETFTTAHAICFTLIWIGVIIFSLDGFKRQSSDKKNGRSKAAI